MQSGQRVRSQRTVTSKLTRLLRRADEVWPVAMGQWELAILAWIRVEERMEAFLSFISQSFPKSASELLLKRIFEGDKERLV